MSCSSFLLAPGTKIALLWLDNVKRLRLTTAAAFVFSRGPDEHFACGAIVTFTGLYGIAVDNGRTT